MEDFGQLFGGMGGGGGGPTSKEFGRSSAEVAFNYSRGDGGGGWVPLAIAGGVLVIVALLILKR